MPSKKLLAAVTLVTLMGAGAAWSADSAIGRITYIYPDGHRIVLDSNTDYTLAPSVDASRLKVAEFVRLGLSGGKVTTVSPGPAALAGDWTGASARS